MEEECCRNKKVAQDICIGFIKIFFFFSFFSINETEENISVTLWTVFAS